MKPPAHIIAALVAATREPSSPLFFTPLKLRTRIDGWTPQRQREYVAGIAATGRAQRAAMLCRLSPQSAARLRHRPDAASLNAACIAAFALSRRARFETCEAMRAQARMGAAPAAADVSEGAKNAVRFFAPGGVNLRNNRKLPAR